MEKAKKIGIFIFDDVEVLDFCGPYEVFNVVNDVSDRQIFEVFTISEEIRNVHARNNFVTVPHYSIDDAPKVDILIIPGGIGARKLLNNQRVLDWIQRMHREVELLLTVCTGSLVVAKTGLLKGLKSTTHHTTYNLLREIEPKTEVIENVKYVDNGKIILAGGISAGINMSLYVVSRLLGEDRARATAKEMEYDWL